QLISKYRRNYDSLQYNEIIRQFESYSQKIDTLEEVDEIMGFEGIGAKLFWNCYRQLLNKSVFERREYRPAPDYINSALNLGYAFLVNEITASLYCEKFDLEIGFLHSIFYGRNSLALDIMEEFRTPFIDAWILKLFNLNILSEKHFKTESEGYQLDDIGFSKFMESYHEHMEEGQWREKFRSQAWKLREALIKNEDYQPYLWE
ncbi:MAG: CRISPR-associated endonuclease Cas1, partial [Filifactor alocis]|nr:CRISPR-associated endonuclease Cas1 [Filifactor alocis]